MKNRLFNHIIAPLLWAMLALTLGACSDGDIGDHNSPAGPNTDSDTSATYSTTFGQLDAASETIITDNGEHFTIAEYGSQLAGVDLAHYNGRVSFNYSILGVDAANDGYFIRLNRFYKLVVKDIVLPSNEQASQLSSPLYESVAPDTEEDEELEIELILEQPALPYQANVSGGYINIYVCYRSDLTPDIVTPDMDLYCDLAASTDDTLCFQLIYRNVDGWGEHNCFQWFSFRIVEEIMPQASSAQLYAFYWKWWVNEREPEEGTEVYTSILHSSPYDNGDRIVTMGF